MDQWLNLLLDALLPRHCILCGAASGEGNVCPPCSGELPRISHPCIACGLPLTHPGDRICGHCQVHPAPWDSAIAAFLYEFPIDQMVRRFKFNHNLACGQFLAQELIRSILNSPGEMPDVIVPVPLHRSRFLTRAYNQSELLARQAGAPLGIPSMTGILYRNRRTRAHSGLDAVSRRINIKGAFRCRISARRRQRMRHVVLVDDVLTTGATLTECTRTLQASGIERVSVWVAARAPAPRAQAAE